MVEVKRKKSEQFDAMLRRFQSRFRASGTQQEQKKEGRRYYSGGKNRNQRRESALRREQKKSQYIYQLKTGQLKEDPTKKRNGVRRP